MAKVSITPGWQHHDYWPANYVHLDYWLEAGVGAPPSTAAATIQEAISAWYRADTKTHDQVGDRIYWAGVGAPQKPTLPYMTHFIVSDPHEPHTFVRGINTGQPRVQFNIYDDNKYRSSTIAETLRNRLRRRTGNLAGKTLINIDCGGTRVLKVSGHDLYQGTFDAIVNYYDT